MPSPFRLFKAAEVRARVRFPATPLLKVRAVFGLLGLAAIASLLPYVAFGGDSSTPVAVLVVSAVAAVAARRIRGLQRGRLTLMGDVIEAAAIVGVCATVGVQQSVGLVYTALYLRALFGSRWEVARGAFLYVAAHAASLVAFGDDGAYTLLSVAQQGPGFVLTVVALAMLARALEDQSRSERRFSALVRNSSDVITVAGPDGRITYQSDAISDMLGLRAEDELGGRLVDRIHPEDAPRVIEHFTRTLAQGDQGPITCRLRHADGSWRWTEGATVNRVDDPDVRGVIIHSRDIAQRKQLEDELRELAFRDSLTGLANRALLNDRVEHALAARRRDGNVVGMLVIDLDDFKTVNDSLGHSAGDLLLAEAARRIAAQTRAEDTVARLGGDEFAILVERNADAAHLTQLAQRLLPALTAPVDLGDERVSLGASIGGATADPSIGAELLLRNADVAMYIAKQSGGGFEFYSDDRDPRIGDRLTIVSELRHALSTGQLDVHLQPLVDLKSDAVVAIEALVCWQHPTRGFVAPDEFLPIAERTGLMSELTRYVLHEALSAAAALAERGHELDVAVNLSPASLEDPSLLDDVRAALTATGLNGERLTFEVTERTLLVDTERARAAVAGLTELGVALSIDDFGTGHSSLARLRHLAVAELKIDRSFVTHMLAAAGDQTIVRSTIGLAHGLGMRVVAEGIEDTDVASLLRELGCDRGQGYGLLPPRPLGELAAWLDARATVTTL